MLLLAITITAIGMVAAQWYIEIRNSQPIGAAVEAFNKKHAAEYARVVPDGKPPLSAEQVIEFLKSDDEIITEARTEVSTIFRRIVNTKRIPNNVVFDFLPCSGQRWLVGMEIMDENARYRINIREIDLEHE
jgi:hypothetical protein